MFSLKDIFFFLKPIKLIVIFTLLWRLLFHIYKTAHYIWYIFDDFWAQYSSLILSLFSFDTIFVVFEVNPFNIHYFNKSKMSFDFLSVSIVWQFIKSCRYICKWHINLWGSCNPSIWIVFIFHNDYNNNNIHYGIFIIFFKDIVLIRRVLVLKIFLLFIHIFFYIYICLRVRSNIFIPSHMHAAYLSNKTAIQCLVLNTHKRV